MANLVKNKIAFLNIPPLAYEYYIEAWQDDRCFTRSVDGIYICKDCEQCQLCG